MIDGKTANEIFDSIRQHIIAGTLRAEDSLPPVRELASELKVNRNTVAAAYKRLITAGLAQSLGRNGTVIKGSPSPVALEGGDPHTPLHDLSGGNPDPQRLPDLSRYFARLSRTPHLYGDAPVSPELHAWAARWLRDATPVAGEIDITSGAIDAIERLLCAHLLPGDSVAVEDPCFLSSINMLRYAGFSASPVSVDSEGMQPEKLERALNQGARAVILTPRAHNPTGCSLSARRAAALQNMLARYPQVLVIIDDHFALLSSSPWQPVADNATLGGDTLRFQNPRPRFTSCYCRQRQRDHPANGLRCSDYCMKKDFTMKKIVCAVVALVSHLRLKLGNTRNRIDPPNSLSIKSRRRRPSPENPISFLFTALRHRPALPPDAPDSCCLASTASCDNLSARRSSPAQCQCCRWSLQSGHRPV